MERDICKNVVLTLIPVILLILPSPGYAVVFVVREPAYTTLPGDSDGDGNIDLHDYALLASHWLKNTSQQLNSDQRSDSDQERTDLDQSGVVDFADLRRIAEGWLSDEESELMIVVLTMDNRWMYQNLPNSTASNLTASVSVAYDPYGNRSYTKEWDFVLPLDVTIEPDTVAGGGAREPFWSFAAPSCDQTQALSGSGCVFKVRVTITGDDYGNTETAEADFAIALLGDVDNDGIVDVADRSIVNAFWQTGSAGPFALRDCDVNCDGVVDVADRSIVNAIYRRTLCTSRVPNPCPLRQF